MDDTGSDRKAANAARRGNRGGQTGYRGELRTRGPSKMCSWCHRPKGQPHNVRECPVPYGIERPNWVSETW